MLIHSHDRPGSESANIRVFIHVFIYKPIDSDLKLHLVFLLQGLRSDD